jgi:hypothetical protein
MHDWPRVGRSHLNLISATYKARNSRFVQMWGPHSRVTVSASLLGCDPVVTGQYVNRWSKTLIFSLRYISVQISGKMRNQIFWDNRLCRLVSGCRRFEVPQQPRSKRRDPPTKRHSVNKNDLNPLKRRCENHRSHRYVIYEGQCTWKKKVCCNLRPSLLFLNEGYMWSNREERDGRGMQQV